MECVQCPFLNDKCWENCPFDLTIENPSSSVFDFDHD